MKKTSWIMIATAFLLILLLLMAGGIYLYIKHQYATVSFSPTKQTETADYLDTPECGWYQLYAYRLKPDTMFDDRNLYLQEKDSDGNPYRIALLEFNLSDYKNQELDFFAEENIKKVFENFKRTKAKVIVRFLYDWDGNGMANEPDTVAMVKRHMEQAGKIINTFRHMIYTTQGIFVGSWGEMHSSKHLSIENMTELLLHYASVLDPSIYLAVRTPEQYRNILAELREYEERYKEYGITIEKLTARLGLFNDGISGSISDMGTYHSTNQYDEKETRRLEMAFQNKLCRHVPNGGETVNDNFLNDWENAVEDLRNMRISYLNQIYDEAVIKKWKNSTYSGEDSLYHGMSAYDYISRHLGYRFVLQNTDIKYEPYREDNAIGTVTIKNTGFSNMYHKKRISVIMVNKETGKRTSALISKKEKNNPCHWTPGETADLSFSFHPSEFDDGEYTLILYMSDLDSREIIPFANESFNQKLGGYELGTVKIKHH